MTLAGHAPIDCDIHPAVPDMSALLPHMNDHWRETIVQRGIVNLDSISYPNNAPLTARPDWRSGKSTPGSDRTLLGQQALDPFGTQLAICNCLFGVQLMYSEDMAAAFARAVNNWIVKEWLDKDDRLRASIIIPVESPEQAVDEIDRCAADPRFVQVMMLAMGEMPLGRRHYWPIYAAAERHGLPLGIHAGSSYRHAVTQVGWPSYYIEDYVAQAGAFQTQLASLICEGVFTKYPELKVVMIESGFTWVASFIWRLHKFWRGLTMEVPWIDRTPGDIVRENVRFTLQPVDAPLNTDDLMKSIEHMGSDELLLFSTDYPHWQFDNDEVLPKGLPSDLMQKIMIDNPLSTYARLREAV